MKKFPVILIFLSLLFAKSFAGAPGDTVKIKAIPYPLTWVVKAIDFKNISDNAVSVTAGKETDFYTFIDGNYYVTNAPKLLFKPDSNFIFSAKVKTAFDSTYDGVGILLYSDSSDWAKLLFERNDPKTIGLGCSVVKNKKTDDSYHIFTGRKEVYLKVAKAGKVFCFYYSLDGKAWDLIRTFGYEKLDSMKIGFYVQSPKGLSCKAEISDIRYKGVGFTDFFTGE